ncbi:MAG TPA: hypothetical protein VEC95_01030 [Terriglobales bacterium]|nr:hypothetical protein [Terriglobales bacterium]
MARLLENRLIHNPPGMVQPAVKCITVAGDILGMPRWGSFGQKPGPHLKLSRQRR